MKKQSFFVTREGEISLCVLTVLASVPVIVLGSQAQSLAAQVIGLLMIGAGMAFPPLRTYLFKTR